MPRVLIVEDNQVALDLLSRRLRRRGFEVLEASDGEAGVRAAREQQPDLILMDVNLPGIDGWEATRILKAAAETEAIPIIAVTSHTSEGDRRQSLAAGCEDHDVKPVDLERLLRKMKALLDRRGVHTEAPPAGDDCSEKDTVTIRADPDLTDLIARYLQGRRDDIPRLRDALDRGDFPALAVTGHKLSGSGTNFGFEAITQIGAALETAANHEDRVALASGIDELEAYLARVRVLNETLPARRSLGQAEAAGD